MLRREFLTTLPALALLSNQKEPDTLQPPAPRPMLEPPTELSRAMEAIVAWPHAELTDYELQQLVSVGASKLNHNLLACQVGWYQMWLKRLKKSDMTFRIVSPSVQFDKDELHHPEVDRDRPLPETGWLYKRFAYRKDPYVFRLTGGSDPVRLTEVACKLLTIVAHTMNDYEPESVDGLSLYVQREAWWITMFAYCAGANPKRAL